MDITLPSGHTAVIRDQFLRGDRRMANRVIEVSASADGSYRVNMGVIGDDVTDALLKRMLIGWDYPQTLPRDAANDPIAQKILDELPDDDYEALAAAVKPWYDKVMEFGQDVPDPKSGSAGTGTGSSAAPEPPGPAQ